MRIVNFRISFLLEATLPHDTTLCKRPLSLYNFGHSVTSLHLFLIIQILCIFTNNVKKNTNFSKICDFQIKCIDGAQTAFSRRAVVSQKR